MKGAIVCVFIAILLFGCATQQQPPGGNQTPPPQPKTGEAVVHISGFKFDPADINVSVGTKVIWVNDDSVMHTVTGDNGEFDLGNFQHGDNKSYTFTKAGNYSYHCNIHPSMEGHVTVS